MGKVLSTKKWCTTWELWVKFYLGQNEDCSPEAASQLRETAPKWQWGKVNTEGFGEGGVQYHEALNLQKVFC